MVGGVRSRPSKSRQGSSGSNRSRKTGDETGMSTIAPLGKLRTQSQPLKYQMYSVGTDLDTLSVLAV
jgi:hypothetical protein